MDPSNSHPSPPPEAANRGRACAKLRERRWDYILAAIGTVLGLLTLWWPLGRSDGLMFYVGREWLDGVVPYRDVFEQKPPLMFAINSLAALLFGPTQVAIHALELVWVIGISQVVYRLLRPADRIDGLRGLCVLAMVVCYQTVNIGLGTAEIWCVGFMLIAWACVRDVEGDRRAFFLAGLFASLAVAAKPPAAMFAPALCLAAYARAGGIARLAPLGFVAVTGALIPWIITFGTFYALGAWKDFVDVFWAVNRFYMDSVSHDREAALRLAMDLARFFWTLHPLSTVAIGTLAYAVWRHRRDRASLLTIAIATLLLCGAVAGVVWQRRLLPHHPTLITPLIAVIFLAAARYSGVKPAVAALVFGLTCAAAHPFRSALKTSAATLRHVSGMSDRDAFIATFNVTQGFEYPASDIDKVGRWIKAHSTRADLIAVRRYMPAVYIIAQRKSATPHFWTPWLTWEGREFKREALLAEDLAALRSNPPTFVVVNANDDTGPDSASYFTQVGQYQEVYRSGDLIVLEKQS